MSEKAGEIKNSISDMLSEKIDEGSELFQEFKAKVSEIYDNVDVNKDSSISLEELKSSLKETFGFNEESEEDQSLV